MRNCLHEHGDVPPTPSPLLHIIILLLVIMEKVSILNPLVSLQWRRCSSLPISMTDAHALWLHDRVYVGGGNTVGGNRMDDAQVYIYTPKTDIWETMNTPVFWYTPCSYHSRLVLVGGVETSTEVTTNGLYLWSGQGWELSPDKLPSMPTYRSCVTALNYDEHILVAGGLDEQEIECNIVEVFNGQCWKTVQPIPRPSYWMRSTVCNGRWYLMGGLEQGKEVFHVSIPQLLSGSTSDNKLPVWSKTVDTPLCDSSPAFFGNHLVAVGGAVDNEGGNAMPTPAIYAYSSRSQTWVYAGNMEIALKGSCTVTLPSGELIFFGGIENQLNVSSQVHIGELEAKQFNLDSQFSMRAISLLEEAAGICLLTTLASTYHILQMKLKISLTNIDQRRILALSAIEPTLCARIVVNSWLAGRSEHEPTWRTLLKYLHSIHYTSIAKQIENYFGVKGAVVPSLSGDGKPAASDLTEQIKALQQQINEQKRHIQAQADQIAALTSQNSEKEETIQVLRKEAERPTTHDEAQTIFEEEKSEGLRGVDICGTTAVVVTNSLQSFQWSEFGLKLQIPENCLPRNVEECTISIRASLSGHFEFPETSHLVSAVYWLQCKPYCQFTKPISVEIQHCAKPENLSQLRFVRTSCAQKELPYTFKKIGGQFNGYSSYGYIELDRFSGIGIAQEDSEERQYCASLYYLSRQMYQPEIDFAIVWNTEAHLTMVKRQYYQEGAIPGPNQLVEFEKDMITLDIPINGVTVDESWRLMPLIRPVVTKYQVDSFQLGRVIPACRLQAILQMSKETTIIPQLIYQVTLLGARHPFNIFTISYSPSLIQTKGFLPQTVHLSTKKRRHETDQQTYDLLVAKLPRLEDPLANSGSDTSPNLKDLMAELYVTVASKWEDIGILLGIEVGILENVKHEQKNDTQSCLREMLKVWLQRVSPRPTWTAIIEAIETIGNEKLALDLHEKYL